MSPILSSTEALERLRAGNERFVAGLRQRHGAVDLDRRREALVDSQAPFAVILGCSDSRVPAEIVFDQGLGDLFVIRVAGNVVNPSQAGSVEFAVQALGTRLVVVLGHSRCGAVSATLDRLTGDSAAAYADSENLAAIVDRVKRAIGPLVGTSDGRSADELLDDAVRANVVAAVADLTATSKLLEERVSLGDVMIVGAEYSLETGVVEFLDD